MKKLLFIFVAIILNLAACGTTHKETVTGAREVGVFQLACYDSAGRLKWTETAHNALADEGEQWILDTFLRGATAPTTFYLRLWNDTPAETDTIATLTGEPSGYGYSAKEVERSNTGWPTLALDSGDYQATSKTVTWTASGGTIGPVTYITLTTSSDSSGKLISYAALSTTRTLASGDSLQATYKLKMQ